MKDTTIRRRFGPEPLVAKRGMELIYAELLEKAQKPSDIKKVKRTKEFRLPCSDVLDSAGKILHRHA